LAPFPARDLLGVAKAILKVPGHLERFVAYELIANHPGVLETLTPQTTRALAGRLDSWGETDMFGYYIAGPAWRIGRLRDADIMAWTRSPDRWWRRAALVATVPLNVRAQGGTGDAARTLRICRALIADRDPMVVKALSWAVRSLVFHEPEKVRGFLASNGARLAPLVRREVSAKLTTGRKDRSRR
jgi:3-methyladenine DNA glycosylase AlkD